MLKKIRESIYNSPLKSIHLSILAFLVTASANIYCYKLETDNLIKHQESIKHASKVENWAQVSSLLEISNIAAQQNAKFLSKKIESDVMRQYDNINDLKKEFDSAQLTPKFNNILKNSLLSENEAPSSLYPPRFNSIVGMRNGIVSIYSNRSSTQIDSINNVMSWDQYIQSSYNPALTKQVIDAVLEKKEGIFFWQSQPGSHQVPHIERMDMNGIKQIYDAGGVEGFKNFSIVTPAYITDNGDIFDNMSDFKNKANYKIIILQSVNMYDIMEKYSSSLEMKSSNTESNVTILNNIMSYKFIVVILNTTILIILCLFFANIYNGKEREKDCRDCKHLKP